MPVRDLAPALLALGELFQEASQVADPLAPPVSLEVRAFNRGSFAASLHVAIMDLGGLLSSPAFQQAALLIGLIADGSRGLFALRQWLRTHFPVRRTEVEPGRVQFQDNHGNTFIADSLTVNLNDRPAIPRLTSAVLQPLTEEGIERMRIEGEAQEEPLELTAEDLEASEENDLAVDPIVDQEIEALVEIIGPKFDPRYKWQLRMGDQLINATLADENYVGKIQRHEVVFLEGDTLRCRTRMRQWTPDAKRPIEWTILEVLDHSHTSGRPMSLFDEPSESDDG